MIVVGVDPGARSTGLAVVAFTGSTARLVTSATITRPIVDGENLLHPCPPYLADVQAAIREATRLGDVELVAVENVNRPRQHLGGERARGGKGGAAADPTALLATAVVLGAVLGRSWAPAEVVVVAPNGHGAGPVGAYPPELRGPRERLHAVGTGVKRHERAAYDVARGAHLTYVLARARR
jgi:hypothetical protein